MPCRATQDGKVMVESSDKIWSTERECQTTLVFLPQEIPQYEKAKKEHTRR